MEENEKTNRHLGDAWQDWDDVRQEKQINLSPWPFINFSIAITVIFNALLYFSFYMIYPRLSSWGNLFVIIAIFIAVLLTCTSIGLVFLTYKLKDKPIKFFNSKILKILFYSILAQKVFGLAMLSRYSLDKIKNSFIIISNNFMESLDKNQIFKKTLILLPRCLNKEIKDQIKQIAAQNNFPTAIVDGGGMARRKICELQPTHVIAVACERDLVSGITAKIWNITIYGLPNLRPNGPCFNTEISMDKFNYYAQKCR